MRAHVFAHEDHLVASPQSRACCRLRGPVPRLSIRRILLLPHRCFSLTRWSKCIVVKIGRFFRMWEPFLWMTMLWGSSQAYICCSDGTDDFSVSIILPGYVCCLDFYVYWFADFEAAIFDLTLPLCSCWHTLFLAFIHHVNSLLNVLFNYSVVGWYQQSGQGNGPGVFCQTSCLVDRIPYPFLCG